MRSDPQLSRALLQCRFSLILPSFSSPKFPQPIFLPTRKFGPTMRTPEELEEPDGRDECPLRLPWDTLAALAGRSPYLSLCCSMARVSGAGQRKPGAMSSEASWAGPTEPQPESLAKPGGCSHSHELVAARPPSAARPVTSNSC